MLIPQLDPLTEQQLMGIYSLQQSTQQAEEALSQGLDQLQQSLVDTIASDTVIDGMHQMGIALGKLANLEGFVRQVNINKYIITSYLIFFLWCVIESFKFKDFQLFSTRDRIKNML